MKSQTPADMPIPPLAIPEERRALARMYIELTLAFHATAFPVDQPPMKTDANQALIAVAVMLGHAEGHPMTASEIAASVHMRHNTVLRRLDVLIKHGLIRRIEDKYYLEATHAVEVPHKDKFEFILSKAFAVLGPYLSKIDN